MFTINYQKTFWTYFGGINSNIRFLVVAVLPSRLFFIFSLDFKNNSHIANQTKPKLTNFFSLRSFYARKIVAFVVFSSFSFVSLVAFDLVFVFVRTKSFRKKRKKQINWFEIILITSFTILLTCTSINLHIENLFVHTYFYLWSSVWSLLFMRISFYCENLFQFLSFVQIFTKTSKRMNLIIYKKSIVIKNR